MSFALSFELTNSCCVPNYKQNEEKREKKKKEKCLVQVLMSMYFSKQM